MSPKQNFRSKGIRIDYEPVEDSYVRIEDIWQEIDSPQQLSWVVQILEPARYYGPEPCIADLEKEVENSPNGILFSWERLSAIARDVTQFENLILIGSKDPSSVKRRDRFLDQYENSFIYIEMFDFGYWEVFSLDHAFIDRLKKKFPHYEVLYPDFQEKD